MRTGSVACGVAVLSVLGLVHALAACSHETVAQPTPPSVDDVVGAFAAPTADLDPSLAGDVRSVVDDAVNQGIATDLPGKIYDAISSGVEEAQASDAGSTKLASTTTGLSTRAFETEGYASVERICDGWGAAAVPDRAANGSMRLTLTFDNLVVAPTVWGTVDRCLYLVQGRRIRLDHGDSERDLRVSLGVATKIEDLKNATVTLALDARVTVDDGGARVGTAVRFVPTASAIDLLVPIASGNLIVTLVDAQIVRVHARNGTYECNTATRACTDPAGNVVVL